MKGGEKMKKVTGLFFKTWRQVIMFQRKKKQFKKPDDINLFMVFIILFLNLRGFFQELISFGFWIKYLYLLEKI